MRLTTLLSLVVLAVGCTQWEVVEATYSSRDQIVRDGAIKRGWIPEWIPGSAAGVREVHDLDTNRSQLFFAYTKFNTGNLEPACHAADRRRIVFPRAAFRSWWPAELTADSVELRRYSLFACPQDREPHAFLAVDATKGRAYFWREWPAS